MEKYSTERKTLPFFKSSSFANMSSPILSTSNLVILRINSFSAPVVVFIPSSVKRVTLVPMSTTVSNACNAALAMSIILFSVLSSSATTPHRT